MAQLPTQSLSVLYADDDTDHAQDKNPDELIRKIQHEADCSAAWVADNKLVCSGAKTKLLVITTDAMRRSRLGDRTYQIQVCGKIVRETECDRILGFLVNNKLSWSQHMLGDFSDPANPVTGLINQLSKRVGMLSRLVNLVPKERFKSLVHGLFFSKLRYGLALMGNVRGTEPMFLSLQETNTRHNSFTKANLNALQILENKILRLLTGGNYDTPIKDMLEDSNLLSVNQLIAFSIITTVFKVQKSNKPVYLAKRLGFYQQEPLNRTHRNQQDIRIMFNLSTAREGFMYKASKLWLSLPLYIKFYNI